MTGAAIAVWLNAALRLKVSEGNTLLRQFG
jgi:hypothetical protein